MVSESAGDFASLLRLDFQAPYLKNLRVSPATQLEKDTSRTATG